MDDARDPETREIFIGEDSIVYCFDFSNESVVIGGETLSAPIVSITNGRALLTLGTPEVLTSEFVEYDENDLENQTVAVGQGVKASVTPLTTKGTVTVTCSVLASGGSRPARKINFKVS